MSERLVVRVTASFFEVLDRQLSVERGPNGEPSSIDFQSVELVEIIERFATGFDRLSKPIVGREDYRILIKSGVLIRAMQITGQQMPDGSVELLRLDLDLTMDWD